MFFHFSGGQVERLTRVFRPVPARQDLLFLLAAFAGLLLPSEVLFDALVFELLVLFLDSLVGDVALELGVREGVYELWGEGAAFEVVVLADFALDLQLALFALQPLLRSLDDVRLVDHLLVRLLRFEEVRLKGAFVV